MTSRKLTKALLNLIDCLPVEELEVIVARLNEPLADPPLEHVLRYQIWAAIDAAKENRLSLVQIANTVLAVKLGWSGAPILAIDDVRW